MTRTPAIVLKDADGTEDLRDAIKALLTVPDHGYSPHTLIMPLRYWDMLATRYFRLTLSRRAFRRWRGRLHAERARMRKEGTL